ncbi:hypothetical protein LTR10_024224 [Elasticomyces elasticus]|uniref:SMP-30/Gluconolactonase/LRE-like region domain-containing protein n=1 Tax=Exophiala sideris TaxID=1016849 RepID=A0ABR0J195_9EURO|nr:hypothetical protein LTR10_024224 [Elasticomyces elasticus]KAK5023500.1 hypothetical protein LTS07_009375 [Exophiala sideris]KAK5028124.1 hypothetical protein LTR13_009112 [Exophiala sideris]KAK5052782.1 hypothetical protein LTR69_009608 [Exophiala sideris]KAK5178393.1 hypothetical protein LTR44_009018 [Eurotiomycetes sp. CCFEE 6388]
MYKHVLGVGATLLSGALAQNQTVFFPAEYSYLLPDGFVGGNTSTQFLTSTSTGNSTIDSLIKSAANASFIALDPDFYNIFGPNPQLELAAHSDFDDFYEAGAWDPKRGRVWFSGSVSEKDWHLFVYDLNTRQVTTPETSLPILAPNGGYYWNDKVYICDFGNQTFASSIIAVDPDTGNSEYVVNSFFGLHLNGPDDVNWVKKNGKAYMFFTDPYYASALNISGPAVLPDGIWRLDPASQDLQAVISRADVLVPNGVAVDANMTKLYVTDTAGTTIPPDFQPAYASSGSAAIYVYDFDEEVRPVNKRLFAYSRSGIPDGIKVDDLGRVWTGEGDGLVIRNTVGKVIAIVNAVALGISAVTNFAIAGDVLVIGGYQNLWLTRSKILQNPACNMIIILLVPDHPVPYTTYSAGRTTRHVW